jgi:hypothetical protein
MNLIDRVKNILTAPPKEWQVINAEPANPPAITTTYLIPLVLIGTVAAFIGYGLIGISLGFGFKIKSTELGIKMAISYAIRSIAGVYILAFIVDALAPNFGAEKNFGKSFQVAAYTATASLVGGIFLILPSLAIIAVLAGLYGLYILYVGLPILKPTKEADKTMTYFLVILAVAIVVNWLLYFIQNQIFYPSSGLGRLSY